jgi:hypothetical protein
MSQLSVDSITGRVAGTSPTFPNGFNVTGVITATTVNQTVTGATSFQGSTTFDNGFTVSGATGIVTATGFVGPLTGNVTGAVTGNADSATLATNAQGLTGTPNITVGTVGCGTVTSSGDVSATNATFSGNATVSGNLTVNGTTTTIDTAVTAVDSLAVDAAISAADYEGNFVLDMFLFS